MCGDRAGPVDALKALLQFQHFFEKIFLHRRCNALLSKQRRKTDVVSLLERDKLRERAVLGIGQRQCLKEFESALEVIKQKNE